jgi:16S rRNA processing protein RimM
LPEKKSAVSKAAAAKPAAKTAPAKKAVAATPRREPKKEPPKPAKAAKAAPPKAAPSAAKTAKPAPAAKAAPAPKPAPVAKKAETKPAAKAAPKVEAKAKVAPAKPEPKAKAAAKAAPEPKKPVAKGKPLPAETKAKPEKPAKVEKPAPAPKPEKPAKAAKPPKPPKPPKPEKPPKLAPVAAALAKPMLAKPMAVAAGRAQPITRTPVTPVRVAPKPLTAPKPVVAEPELVGEPQAVPAFKAKNGAKGMVLVGAIAGAFGVKGEVRLRAFTDKSSGVISYGPLYGEDGKILLKPKSWRELKDGVAVIAAEVKSREEAETMKGQKLFVPRANLPATAEDEYYVVDLLGSRAESLDGTILGDIVAVWNFGAGDILEYKPPNGGPNVRITFTREAVPHVDLAAKRVVLDPPAPEPVGK